MLGSVQKNIPNRSENPERVRRAASVDRVGIALLSVLAGTAVLLAAIIEIGLTLPAWAVAIVLTPAVAAVVATLVLSVTYPPENDRSRGREGGAGGEHSDEEELRASLRAATERAGQSRPLVGSGDRG